jgi:tape measure domain-containing protein
MAINLGNILFGLVPNFSRLSPARNQVNQLAQSVNAAAEAQERMTRALARTANVASIIYGPLGGVASRINVLANLADKFSLGTASLVGGVSAGVAAFMGLSAAALDAARAMEKVNLTLEAVAGSSALNSRSLEYLRGVADRAGKSIRDIAPSYARLEAASKGTNLEGSRTRQIFENVVMAGAKLGSTTEEVQGTLRALEQIMSKGSVQAEELRGQLGDRLPGAFNIMADALGVSTEKLNDLMKQGKITADALLPFANELARRFGVDATKGIDTITAAEGRWANASQALFYKLDQILGISEAWKNFLNVSAQAANALTKFLGGVVTPAEQFGAAIQVNAKALREAGGASASFREQLEAQILSQKFAAQAALQEAEAQLAVAKAKAQANIDRARELEQDPNATLLDAFINIGTTAFDETYNSIDKATGEVDGLRIGLKAINDQLLQIEKVRAGLGEKGDKPLIPIGTGEDSAATLRAIAKSAREAEQAIAGTRNEWQILMLPPAEQEFAKRQNSINEKVQTFKDKLVDAKVPLEQVTALTARYRSELGMLEEVQYRLENFPSIWKELAVTLGQGLDTAMGRFVDDVFAGKDALAGLADVGRMVAADLIKTFAQLAVINPIKNALFGGNPAGGMFPSFNPLSFLMPSNQSTGMFGGGSSLGGFGSYGKFAGGGSFKIPGGGGMGGMDSQLVSFMGKPGETVSIGKTGHGAAGEGGDYYEGNTYIINAQGAQPGVEQMIMAAIKAYDKTATVRLQRDTVKAKARRVRMPT